MGRERKFRNDNFRGRKSRMLDFDGDIDMAHSENQRRFNPYAPSRANRKNHNKNIRNKRKSYEEINSWFRITIPRVKKSGKDFLLKTLSLICKEPLLPVNFQFNGNSAEFFLSNASVAYQLKNRKITTPDGSIKVHAVRVPPPETKIDSDALKAIEECMSDCYDIIGHNLNISKFHHNERLNSRGLYLNLNTPIVANSVVNIIKERIPEIEVLNLSDNKLSSLHPFSSLVSVCKMLKSVNLQNNKIRNVSQLNSFKGLELLDLNLEHNPLCKLFEDNTSYRSAARDLFPKLLRLDNIELPPPISFDLGTETCPVSKKCFFAESEGSAPKDLVIQFLDQYYTIYDSGDRSKLVDAYNEHACFSLCLSINSPARTNGGPLSHYSQDNRNLLKVTDFSQRFKLLKQGKLSIVAALSELPQTMHDPSSFSIDIYHISPTLMSFSVIGVFKEVGAEINKATSKTFSRTFVVAPHSSGIAIINETLFIAHASQDQQKKAFKVPAPTPSSSPVTSSEEKSPNEKQLMVLELSKQTGMNLDFSSKCLDENDWDYQKALTVFMKLKAEEKIPLEAFMNMKIA